jgi:hypothetical protein
MTSAEFGGRVHAEAQRAGQPLPSRVRGFLEPRFGVGLGDVRMHTDVAANRLARQINARAFTLRKDVFFGADQARSYTRKGMQLFAHEVAHTLQTPGSVGATGREARAGATDRIQRSPLSSDAQEYPSRAEQRERLALLAKDKLGVSLATFKQGE